MIERLHALHHIKYSCLCQCQCAVPSSYYCDSLSSRFSPSRCKLKPSFLLSARPLSLLSSLPRSLAPSLSPSRALSLPRSAQLSLSSLPPSLVLHSTIACLLRAQLSIHERLHGRCVRRSRCIRILHVATTFLISKVPLRYTAHYVGVF